MDIGLVMAGAGDDLAAVVLPQLKLLGLGFLIIALRRRVLMASLLSGDQRQHSNRAARRSPRLHPVHRDRRPRHPPYNTQALRKNECSHDNSVPTNLAQDAGKEEASVPIN
jgi:hypothetical protein